MSSLARRGVAALAVASVLLFAPLASTAAYADDEPIVETPLVETPPVETPPVETPPVETPSSEAPASEEPPADNPPAEAAPPADETPSDDPPIEGPPAVAPSSFAPAPDCDVSATQRAATLCIDFIGATATLSIARTANGDAGGYLFMVTDWNTFSTLYDSWPRSQTNSTPAITLTPGETYYFYGDDSYDAPALLYTFPLPAAPNHPVNLSVDRLQEANGFDLTWDAPEEVNDNPVVNYEVTLTPLSTNVPATYVTSSTSYQLTGLTIGEEYGIDVRAIATDGQPSVDVSTAATLEATAPTAVTGLVLTRVGEDLSASWTAPAYNGGVGPVWYEIDVYADGGLIDQVEQTGTTITLEQGAEYGVEYSITVTPYTSDDVVGASTGSNTVERPDSVPTAPTAYAMPYGHKNAMIYATWDLASSASSPVEDVILSLYDTSGSLVDQVTLDLGVGFSGWNFDELANDTAYAVGVVAVNDAGSSVESARVPATTLSLVPPALTPLELALVGNYANLTVSLTGSTLTAHIDGMHEGDWVFGYAHSTPAPLGWTQVDAAGFASWSVNGAGLGSGNHTLVVMESFGAPLGSAGFSIAAARPAALAQAGTDPSGWMTIAAAMLALGILASVRQSRRKATR